ncbi:hypothetical protein PIB30_038463 [Stylosanthes scabra]|uniref:Uncharacterized protein n=1 Tax=Stylosanthes scabra TaxID=79078 RepID=A0ABU6ZC18_9FABA|nr:hypothetical protein [Stylosanthes scabra]
MGVQNVEKMELLESIRLIRLYCLFRQSSWERDAPARGGDFRRCSSESPLSLADGVWNVLKEVSQGATKIPSRTWVVLLRKRKGKSIFDWGWLQLRLIESSSQVGSS